MYFEGRLSSEYKIGEVTTWQDVDLPYVQAVMGWEIPNISAAGVFPSLEQVQEFYASLHQSYNSEKLIHEESMRERKDDDISGSKQPSSEESLEFDLPLSKLMNRFVNLSQLDNRYFLCDFKSLNLVSNWLHSIKLTIEDRYALYLLIKNIPIFTFLL